MKKIFKFETCSIECLESCGGSRGFYFRPKQKGSPFSLDVTGTPDEKAWYALMDALERDDYNKKYKGNLYSEYRTTFPFTIKAVKEKSNYYLELWNSKSKIFTLEITKDLQEKIAQKCRIYGIPIS